jgi:hypothetical protein
LDQPLSPGIGFVPPIVLSGGGLRGVSPVVPTPARFGAV